jgi:hypothetical protein
MACFVFVIFHIREIKTQLLLDLMAIRMTEPVSKLRSIELFETYSGILYGRLNYYLLALNWLKLNERIETFSWILLNGTTPSNLIYFSIDVTTEFKKAIDAHMLNKLTYIEM